MSYFDHDFSFIVLFNGKNIIHIKILILMAYHSDLYFARLGWNVINVWKSAVFLRKATLSIALLKSKNQYKK